MISYFYLFLIVLLVILVYQESELCSHTLRFRPPYTAPLPSSMVKTIQRHLQVIPNLSSYTLIDLGCGEGHMLQELYPLVKRAIGVETEKRQANETQIRFLSNRSIHIYHKDLVQYSFEDQPTVVYLYEPLWKSESAKESYETIVSKLQQLSSPVYIVYLSGLTKKELSSDFFKAHQFSVLHSESFPRALLWNQQLYIIGKSA